MKGRVPRSRKLFERIPQVRSTPTAADLSQHLIAVPLAQNAATHFIFRYTHI